MRSKIIDIKYYHRIICIYDDKAKVNPFYIYRITWDNGQHRKLMERYADFNSVLCWIKDNVVVPKEKQEGR